MVDMTCPITGAVLHIADERVEKYENAGYKRVGAVEKAPAPADETTSADKVEDEQPTVPAEGAEGAQTEQPTEGAQTEQPKDEDSAEAPKPKRGRPRKNAN